MEDFLKDLRYALRMLLKSPGFTLIAVLALGLGIGANTAIFSVFNGMLWRPLPVKDPQQIVYLASQKTKVFGFPDPLSYPDVQDYRQLKAVFSDVIAYAPNPVNLGVGGHPERAWCEYVTGNYFSMLGLEPALGRTFAPDEGWVPDKDTLMVLAYSYWQKRFGGDPAIIGQTVQVNNHPFTIIGVAPERYHGAYYFLEPNFYIPITTMGLIDPTQRGVLDKRSDTFLRVLGRLQPGVTPAEAMAAAEPLDHRLAQEFPEDHKSVSLLVLPELKARPEPGLGGLMSTFALIFMLLVGLVLLIACANVANLILARANGRRKEFATRTALGASRGRMIRQLLTESVLLSTFGGLLGLLFARWAALGLMSIHLPSEVPVRLFDLSLDWRIFAFAFFVALMTGIVAGLVPSLQASRTDLADTLKAGGRSGGASAGHALLRNGLVVSQVAVSLLLLACTGFFIRSLENSAHVDMGFRADHILLMSVDLGLQGYSEQRGQQFYKQLSERVRSLPGVRDAAFASFVPMGDENSLVDIFPEGQVIDGKTQTQTALEDEIQPSYFRSAGTPVIEGREFNESDNATAPKVAIINDTFAKKIWPGQDPIGKTFRIQKDGPPIQVVGLTRTGKYLFLYEPPQPYVYFPLTQRYAQAASLFVYTKGDPEQILPAVRDEIRQLDASLPIFGVTTMDAHVEYGKPLLPARLAAMFVGTFGILGLILASVGIYGVVSYSVSQRTQEIGIRTALGARRSHVLGMVLKQGMSMALIGIGIGIVLSFLLFRGLGTVLYGVKSTDLVTLFAVSATLLGVAFAASYVPALRATRVDPVVALREQ
jgi:predicted permease